MKLPDFNAFPPILELRRRMGVTETVTLGTAKWDPLRVRGIDIEDISDIETGDDGTLIYEGQRVLIYIRDVRPLRNGREWTPKFHVAECRTIESMRASKRFGRYVATNRRDGLFIVNYFDSDGEIVDPEAEAALLICRNCLTALDWEGYEDAKPGEKKRIFQSFSVDEYFEYYGTSLVDVLPDHDEFTSPVSAYTADWNDVSKALRESVGWKCDACGLALGKPSHREFLHVHHIDGNRGNNSRSNLRPLCLGCHAEQPMHEQLMGSPSYADFLVKRTLGEFGA